MTVTPIADQIAALQAQLAKLQAHRPPRVVFRATARKGQPLTWDFTATATTNDAATVAAVHWDFGQSTFDGTSLAAPGYVWQTPGAKLVKVTVTDSWGAVGGASARITVTAPAPAPAPVGRYPAPGKYPAPGRYPG